MPVSALVPIYDVTCRKEINIYSDVKSKRRKSVVRKYMKPSPLLNDLGHSKNQRIFGVIVKTNILINLLLTRIFFTPQ